MRKYFNFLALMVLLTCIINIQDGNTLYADYNSDSYIISNGDSDDFCIADEGKVCSIYVDLEDYEVCRIAADCLASDIEAVCGHKPVVYNNLKNVTGDVIIVGTIGKSKVVDTLVKRSKLDISSIKGKWETFSLVTINDPTKSLSKALVISGSDRRGTAFGVFDLSENIGVSPWFWWADVPVKASKSLYFPAGRHQEGPPSVKYRGIFINDEDWGLHPWSKDNYSPEDGYIGPKTYKKVFELLLRLKANYIWPGMHKCTKAFHAFEENKVVADQYAIVAGSSHCEQMSRNNVWEWYRWNPSDGSDRGDWDWCKNSDSIVEYWRDAVAANGQYENVYTMGMRGIHDSGMPCTGVNDAEKAVIMQDEVFVKQREIIAQYVNSDVTAVPQIFCPYKEVLGLYNMGMKVPDDITLVWPDDNHGYIRNLSNTAERGRSGRSGVYYHVSYWGHPHDYLWLCSTPPALIWEEMKKAYDYGADNLWVFNVGDIKPAEICMEYGLQMAWDISKFDKANVRSYLTELAIREYGPKYSAQIADILIEYYRLGQARKPEHMSSGGAKFNMNAFGDELERRIASYESLAVEADKIYEKLPESAKDAYYQMILYQLRCASYMNQKILYAQKNLKYASQGRVSANKYAELSRHAYERIIEETDYYNNVMASGKWKGMMSWRPRDLSVFNMPAIAKVNPQNGSNMGVVVEGNSIDITGQYELSDPFAENFTDGKSEFWKVSNENRWEIRSYDNEAEYAINTSDYSNISGHRLGELAVADGKVYNFFNLACQIRCCDDLSRNGSADYAIVFSYIDPMNYHYMIVSNSRVNSAIHKIVNGSRSIVAHLDVAITDNAYHIVEIDNDIDGIIVRFDGKDVAEINQEVPAGAVGFGSYNDSMAVSDFRISSIDRKDMAESLPVFDKFTRKSHFIDIFNKGDSTFKWAAKLTEPWIVLDVAKGTVSDQQRIWASVNWEQLPVGISSGNIIIQSDYGEASINIKANNPAVNPSSMDCFVQSDGYISIEAENYTNNISKSGITWNVIETLGISGDSIAVEPVTVSSCDKPDKIITDSPCVQYELFFTDTGKQTVSLYCIPTHAISSEHGLRYAVAFDNQSPVIVDFEALEWTPQWDINVVQGTAVSTSEHLISTPGEHTLNIWMVDPGVVIDKVVIGDPKLSHLGPPETKIVK